MGLLSFFKRRADAASNAATPAEPAEAVQQARTRARQRLIGAAVLVVIGVIGFPLVFETQPRPVPVDIPIEIPRKEGAAPLPMPTARTPSTAMAVPPNAPAAPSSPSIAAAPRDDVITESRSEAGREVAAPAKPVAPPASVAEHAAPKPKPEAKTEVAKKPMPAAPAADTARARALLEGEPAAKAEAGRFVVQVGAFAEVAAARETRHKVEQLGMKTYTQVAKTATGSRIRVRVGPFASREDADKAMAKARAAGITAVVLTL